MFCGDVPEKLIMERSGHRSLEGVRQYEQVPYRRCKYARYWRQKKKTEKFGQPLENPTPYRPPQTATQPSFFLGCTFTNCTFQLPKADDEDFSDINIKEFLQF